MQEQFFETSDGARLRYLVRGQGQPLLLLPGWSQSAELFRHQIEDFSEFRQVVALDWRGHGGSGPAGTGYRVARFAADLQEFLRATGFEQADILAHSMGASVVWAWWCLFGKGGRPARLVLVDEPPAILARPSWSAAEREMAGCLLSDLQALSDFCDLAKRATGEASMADLLRSMFTPSVTSAAFAKAIMENLKLDRGHAADLLEDNALQDWRAVIATIDVPTLVVSGEASQVPVASQRWVARTIPNASFDLVPARDGGSHFMFLENPRRFNARVRSFLLG